MARTQRDDSMSDAVFSEDDMSVHSQDLYSPRGLRVFSPNSSMGSVRDIYSPRAPSRDQTCSPAMSNYSTYSQEVKYIFDPNLGMCDLSGNSTEDDYSQIQFAAKKVPLQRKLSNTSQYSHHSVSSVQPPPPPPRTSSTCSQLSDSNLRHHQPHPHPQQPHPQSQLPHPPPPQHHHQPPPPPLPSSHLSPHTSSYYYPYRQTRRKTWSPEGLKLGFAASMKRDNRVRSYSNEQLLEQVEPDKGVPHGFEELEPAPPKLAQSGQLSQSPGRGIIRPIAFKPVVANQKFLNPPHQFVDHPRKYSSHDDGYGSQDYSMNNQNAANTSHGSGSVQMECDRLASFSSDYNRHSDRPDSVPSSNVSQLSSNHMESYVQTPSPSDSGVGELEAILKEKDAEINTLRDVMDKNERAIFQVYEDRKSSWIKEYRELKDEYDKKVKLQQRKAYKTEQVLNLQLYKLQQEKKAIKEENEKLGAEKDDLAQKCEAYAEETNRLQAQLDDATWQGRRQTGDTTELQDQLDSLQSKLTAKCEEVIRLQSEVERRTLALEERDRERRNRLQDKGSRLGEAGLLRTNNTSGVDVGTEIALCRCEKQVQTDFMKARSPEQETLKPSLICEKDREVSTLKEEVDKIELELLVSREEFEKEKEQWMEEKNKVIMYQKQLQLNYVQMFRKNKVLEAEVEQLTLELESRDMKLMALSGGEESVC